MKTALLLDNFKQKGYKNLVLYSFFLVIFFVKTTLSQKSKITLPPMMYKIKILVSPLSNIFSA